MKLTRQAADDGREIIRKDGEIVADITPDAEGRGLWVHYFGPTRMNAGPHLANDMKAARDLVKMAAGTRA